MASPELLVRQAERLPGVAEAMEVFRRAEEVLSKARPYLKELAPRVVYRTSDGST